jgi:hypothetical protein
MEYIKVPYVRLKGKKYGGDLSPEEEESVSNLYQNSVEDGASEMYGGTFQEIYKTYKNGEDPVEAASSVTTDQVVNPEKMLALHDAISTIAKKYGYDAPEGEPTGIINLDTFKKIIVPNSYFVARQDYGETILIVTDNDSVPTYIGLPVDNDFEMMVDVDKNGNILIPKDAYDEDLDVF